MEDNVFILVHLDFGDRDMSCYLFEVSKEQETKARNAIRRGYAKWPNTDMTLSECIEEALNQADVPYKNRLYSLESLSCTW